MGPCGKLDNIEELYYYSIYLEPVWRESQTQVASSDLQIQRCLKVKN
jgi:hypothetical protein